MLLFNVSTTKAYRSYYVAVGYSCSHSIDDINLFSSSLPLASLFFFLFIPVVVVGAVHLTARCQQWVFLFFIRSLYPAALTQKRPFLLHLHLLVQQCVWLCCVALFYVQPQQEKEEKK